ncbi:hypothetical protein A9Q89_03350 [Gammaproteobacteria bacterium 53_120_T64]|nr:hypothetical protein A9Q89_03350 [Gammaproteobacteria bacterium 53_120_T64]
MKWILPNLLVSALIYLSPAASAAVVGDLYNASVDVADQELAQRQAGFSSALAEVLIKTTGSKAIVQRPSVVDALSQASQYMVKYAYVERPIAPAPLLEPVLTDSTLTDTNFIETSLVEPQQSGETGVALAEVPAYRLSVQFSKGTINGLMRTLDLPIWPANRPEILVWVVEQSASGYRFVEGPELPKDLLASFRQRGLPVQLPLYDLGDQLALNSLGAWSLNREKLNTAVQRYGIDHWLVLRYSKVASGAIRGSWYLGARSGNFAGEGAVLNTLQADSTADFLQSSVDQVVDHLAGQLAYFADAEASLFRVVVENIGNFAAYSQLNDFLSGLEIVNGVKVRSIAGDTITLDLATEGESRVLLRALNKEARLSLITELGAANDTQVSATTAQTSRAVAYFRWQAAR